MLSGAVGGATRTLRKAIRSTMAMRSFDRAGGKRVVLEVLDDLLEVRLLRLLRERESERERREKAKTREEREER